MNKIQLIYLRVVNILEPSNFVTEFHSILGTWSSSQCKERMRVSIQFERGGGGLCEKWNIVEKPRAHHEKEEGYISDQSIRFLVNTFHQSLVLLRKTSYPARQWSFVYVKSPIMFPSIKQSILTLWTITDPGGYEEKGQCRIVLHYLDNWRRYLIPLVTFMEDKIRHSLVANRVVSDLLIFPLQPTTAGVAFCN